MKKVYIAGPLFTEGERNLLEKIDVVCAEYGYITYLPHRDAGVFTREDDSSRIFFEKDLLQLDGSDLVVAVFNGVDVDSGTSWEVGYFYAKKCPIIGFVEDSRIFDLYWQINPMLINSTFKVVRNFEELRSALEEVWGGELERGK